MADLRNHGSSAGFAPPHTIATAAEDVLRTLRAARMPGPCALVGHSLGGKVSLAVAASAPSELVSMSPANRVDVFILDSFPGAGPPPAAADGDVSAVRSVLELVAAAPAALPSRKWVAEAAAARGLDAGVASWLASSTTREPAKVEAGRAAGGSDAPLRWIFDPHTAASLYADYLRADFWPLLLEGSSEPGLHVHVIMASRSRRWEDEDTSERVRSAAAAQAARDAAAAAGAQPLRGRVTFHTVESGHWVHVDAAEDCLRIMETEMLR